MEKMSGDLFNLGEEKKEEYLARTLFIASHFNLIA